MSEVDKLSVITEQEYRDGLQLAEITRHRAWPLFLSFCKDYIEKKKEEVFENLEDQLAAINNRGCGRGVGELLVLLNDQIKLALAQQEREAEANSAEKEQ